MWSKIWVTLFCRFVTAAVDLSLIWFDICTEKKEKKNLLTIKFGECYDILKVATNRSQVLSRSDNILHLIVNLFSLTSNIDR